MMRILYTEYILRLLLFHHTPFYIPCKLYSYHKCVFIILFLFIMLFISKLHSTSFFVGKSQQLRLYASKQRRQQVTLPKSVLSPKKTRDSIVSPGTPRQNHQLATKLHGNYGEKKQSGNV